MNTAHLSFSELQHLFASTQGYFSEFGGNNVSSQKLSESISAFANADGGEIILGIGINKSGRRSWQGFDSAVEAQALAHSLALLVPNEKDCLFTLLSVEDYSGFLMQVEVAKNREIIKSIDGKIFVRRGADNHLIRAADELQRLQFNKGLSSFETMTVDTSVDVMTESEITEMFIKTIVPQQSPDVWFKRQNLILSGKPTVAGVVLFADEPQAFLPKRCGIKIYRFRTADDEGTREALDGLPVTVEGCAYRQVYAAVAMTKQTIEGIRRMTPSGLTPIEYPEETIHEIITNAVLHRDYSIPDDIHIRIYDNRVEVESPGSLPGHITPKNILEERFARNGNLVRIINKFPNPPNKDIGEGLNTAFRAMQKLHLKEPDIIQKDSSVLVIIKHEQLASPEERIMSYLESNPSINNGKARELCVIREDWRIRSIFSRMVDAGMIEKIPGSTTSNTAYQKKNS